MFARVLFSNKFSPIHYSNTDHKEEERAKQWLFALLTRPLLCYELLFRLPPGKLT